MPDDFTRLTEANHSLDWLGNDPAQSVRNQIQTILQKQEPTAVLQYVKLVGKPEFLTGGRKLEHDPDHLLLTRAGLAVAFDLEVKSEKGVHQLQGVFSWVASHFDGDRRDQVFLDIDKQIDEAAKELILRIYEIDLEEEPLAPHVRWWEFWKRPR